MARRADSQSASRMILHTAKHCVAFEIDEEDFEVVSYYSWHIHHEYVCTMAGKQPNQYGMRIQNLLLGKPPKGFEWDHKNQNKLDNRRSNLRLATRVVQTRNTPLQCNNTSGVRGVHKIHNKWMVRIGNGVRGNRITIGRYDTLEEAQQARQQAEILIWGNQR